MYFLVTACHTIILDTEHWRKKPFANGLESAHFLLVRIGFSDRGAVWYQFRCRVLHMVSMCTWRTQSIETKAIQPVTVVDEVASARSSQVCA